MKNNNNLNNNQQTNKNRRQHEAFVKNKIRQILLSVKQQKQHIQNQLSRNDRKIRQYCQQYSKLKQNDFSEMRQQQKQLLKSICEGLQNQGIQATKIIGQQCKLQNQTIMKNINSNKNQNHNKNLNKQYKSMTNSQIIKVQEMLIVKLLSAIQNAQNYQQSFQQSHQ